MWALSFPHCDPRIDQDTMQRHRLFQVVVVLTNTLVWLATSFHVLTARGEVPLNIPYKKLAELEDARINESSGLACSSRSRDLFWTHNDSGSKAKIYAFDRQGQQRGSLVLKGIKPRDWEDMASFHLDGRPCLLIGDIGDNLLRAKSYPLILIEEPELNLQNQNPTEKIPATILQTVHFQYADGAHDCEAMAFDPVSRRVYLTIKSTRKSSAVYVLPWPAESTAPDTPLIAAKVATVNFPLVTAMDISSDGHFAVMLTYGLAFEFVRDTTKSWEETFNQPSQPLLMPFRRQGETICYGPQAKTLYLTSEKIPTPLFEAKTGPRGPKSNASESAR